MSVLFRDVYLYDADAYATVTGPTDLLTRGNRIDIIGAGAHAKVAKDGSDPRVVDGNSRLLITPGLINGHFHSPANHLKGGLPSMPLEVFMLHESPADPALTPTPHEAYLRTMLGALEMLRTGTTAVQDDAFLMPYPTPEIIDAVMQAYADSGIRASVALDQPELPETQKLPITAGLAPPQQLQGPAPMGAEGLLAAYEHLIGKWHTSHGGRLTAAVSVSAPQRVSVDYFRALDRLSATHHIPLFAHMLETKLQRTLATTQPRFAGRSLVQYTADLGLLNERTNVIHAVWTDEHDLELIAQAGATIAHNPVSNLRLGSGVAPFRRFCDAKIPVALGVDEAICDDSCNMWGVVKLAGLIHNITGEDYTRWPVAAEVLSSVWQGGAAAMLQGDRLGSIREGHLADLTVLDLHSPAFTPLNDVPGQLVYCESGAGVVMTMVDGRPVYEAGSVNTVDEAALLSEAREVFARKQIAIHQARSDAATLEPYYRSLVREAARTDVGMNRWVGTP